MSPAEMTLLKTLVDRARRAQIDAQGGYAKVERDAQRLDRELGAVGHGKTRYSQGCRCDICTVAHRFYQREWHRRNRPVAERPPVGFLTRAAAEILKSQSPTLHPAKAGAGLRAEGA